MRNFSVIITSLYLVAVTAAFVIMLLTQKNTPMSGIFLVMLTFPWSLLLSWIQNLFHVNSAVVNGLFLYAAGLLNGGILYTVLSFLSTRFQR